MPNLGMYELVVMSMTLPSLSDLHLLMFVHRYSLPEHVREHIDFLSPGIKLSAVLRKTELKRDAPATRHYKPGPMKKLPEHNPNYKPPPGAGSLPADLQDCGRNITPVCLKALYHIPDAHIKDSVNRLGLYEDIDTYSQDDLNSFFALYAPYVPQGTHPLLDSVDGGEAPVAAGSDLNTAESDIDLDLSFSLIYVSSLTVVF
jgi:tripeptidyl-peptidase-1